MLPQMFNEALGNASKGTMIGIREECTSRSLKCLLLVFDYTAILMRCMCTTSGQRRHCTCSPDPSRTSEATVRYRTSRMAGPPVPHSHCRPTRPNTLSRDIPPLLVSTISAHSFLMKISEPSSPCSLSVWPHDQVTGSTGGVFSAPLDAGQHRPASIRHPWGSQPGGHGSDEQYRIPPAKERQPQQ